MSLQVYEEKYFRMKKVLITGILGQDGANMAELLLEQGDIHVYGMMRRSGSPNYTNIKEFRDNKT